MEFVPAAALLVLIKQVVDFLRYLRGGDGNGVFTILVAWVAGVAGTTLVAQTDWASGIAVGDFSLGTLNFPSLVFVGMSLGAGAGGLNDLLGAIDSSRSTAKPKFLPTSGEG